MPPKRKIDILISARDRTRAAFNSVALGLKGISDVAGRVRGALAGILTIGTGASLAGIKAFTNEVDTLAKTASKLGIATEELSKLRFAAELTGVGANQLDTALQRLSRRIAEAAQGAGEAKDAIAELGLDARALAELSVDEQFRRIADAFQSVKNKSDQVRLAFKLFDSGGVALLNTIDGGSAKINEFGDELERLGGVITEDTAKASEAFNDNVLKMQKSVDALTVRIGNKLIPKWNAWLDLINDPSSFHRLDAESGTGIKAIDRINEKLVGLKERRDELNKAQPSLARTLFGDLISGAVTKELEKLNRDIDALTEERAGLINSQAESNARKAAREKEQEHNKEVFALRKQAVADLKAELGNQLKVYNDFLKGLEEAQKTAVKTAEGFNEAIQNVSTQGPDNPFDAFLPKDKQGKAIESWADKTINAVSPVIAIYDQLSTAQQALNSGDFEGALAASAAALESINQSMGSDAWVNPQSIIDLSTAFNAIVTEAESGIKVQIDEKQGDIDKVKNKIKTAGKDAKIDVEIAVPDVKIKADDASVKASRAAVVEGLSQPVSIPVFVTVHGITTALPAGTRGSSTPGVLGDPIGPETIFENESDKRGHRVQ